MLPNKYRVLLAPLLFSLILIAVPAVGKQQMPNSDTGKGPGGQFSLGVRSTFSAFSHDEATHLGTGMGGQFRLRFSRKVNSEWFADYIFTQLEEEGFRADYHIGWSVMYYLRPMQDATFPSFSPYLVGGHCFDFSKIKSGSAPAELTISKSMAVQGGAGLQVLLTPRLDATLIAQYMTHIGAGHKHAPEDEHAESHKGAFAEDHLLITVSMNYQIAALW